MGARYYFFTDPALLAAQGSPDAFGPASPVSGNDLFHITDNHAFSTAAPAFAICDGLICAQKDETGTLTLILKPAEQPPFDFPAISYILYKGIDPTSLLNGDGDIDTSKIDTPLIDAIKATWELPDNGNGTTTPSRTCLGLHLNPADYPSDQHPERFADGAPLDTLFYDGDPAIQMPLARGGWKLGTFSATGGLEIVVERLGRRPKLTLARTRDNVLAVASRDPNVTYAANDATAFMHWHAKEACLDFVDPCALWGSFFNASLRAWNGSAFDKLTGNAIYETVLRGTSQGSANFANRNRAYIDLRNEHGQSLDYYKADGPKIQFTLDAAADIDACEIDYYSSGWPCFWTDNANLPAGTTGDRIQARLALNKTFNTRPLIYLAVGYRGHLHTPKERQRFLDRPRRGDSPYQFEISITLPLASESGTTHLLAGYSRLHQFKRLAIVNGQPVPAADPSSLAPLRASAFDCLLPLLSPDDLPAADAPVVLRTYDDLYYVEPGAADGDGFVASPVVAADNVNVVLALVPRVHNQPAFSLHPRPVKVAWPSLTQPTGSDNVFTYLEKLLPTPLNMVEVANPETSSEPIELLYGGSTAGIYQDVVRNNPSTITINLSRAEIADLQTIVAAANAPVGVPMLSMSTVDTYRDDVTSYSGFAVNIDLLAGAQTIMRVTQPSQVKVYCHEAF